ncbi:tetratricopeptide repeat protein [Xanthobacter sp. DSM 24535]|uniref:tetratricopeptide repeat protein n=1 Tax=Roseixanthobacter psychrophilus TaxID=3119917 RepID=UPI003728EA3C
MSPDPRTILGQAAAFARAGQVDKAIEGFRLAVQLQPSLVDAHRMLAMALIQAGRPEEALPNARRTANMVPKDPNAAILLAVALQGVGQFEKALAAAERAIKLAPQLGEAHFQAANALGALGRHEAAAKAYTRVLERDPLAVEALANRSVALVQAGHVDAALADCERLLELQPWSPIHPVNKGFILLGKGDPAAAKVVALHAIKLAPDFVDGHHLLGECCFVLGDMEGAAAAYEQAVTRAPQRPDLRLRYAFILRRLGAFAAACAQADAVLEAAASNPAALFERAMAREGLGEAEGALEDLDAMLAVEPPFTEALLARARLQAYLGARDDGRATLAKALHLDPHNARVLEAKAGEALSRAAWPEGWAALDAAAQGARARLAARNIGIWDGTGSPPALVVSAGESLSDTLALVRLLPVLADRGIEPRLLVADAAHAALFANVDPRVRVVSDPAEIDPAQEGVIGVALGSLPHLIAPDPSLWPQVPYLQAPPDRRSAWSHARSAGDLVIGIHWQSEDAGRIDPLRSVPLEAFGPLAALDGVRLVALQQGPAAAQMDHVSFRGKILRLESDFDADGTFLDSAGLIHHLDLIVSVDAPLAHLAGAMNRPVFVAAGGETHFAFGGEGPENLFYPSVRTVRQGQPGQWGGVFTAIAAGVQMGKAENHESK